MELSIEKSHYYDKSTEKMMTFVLNEGYHNYEISLYWIKKSCTHGIFPRLFLATFSFPQTLKSGPIYFHLECHAMHGRKNRVKASNNELGMN